MPMIARDTDESPISSAADPRASVNSDWVKGTPLRIEDCGEYGRGEDVDFRLTSGVEVELFDLNYLIGTSWVGKAVKVRVQLFPPELTAAEPDSAMGVFPQRVSQRLPTGPMTLAFREEMELRFRRGSKGVWIKWPETWTSGIDTRRRLHRFFDRISGRSLGDEKCESSQNLGDVIEAKLKERGINVNSIPPEYADVWEYNLIGVLRLENESGPRPAAELLTDRGPIPVRQIVTDTGVGSFGTYHTGHSLANLGLSWRHCKSPHYSA